VSCAAALLFGGCPRPAAPAAPELPPFTDAIEAAGRCTVRGAAVAPDARVGVAIGHRAAITLAGTSIPDAGGDTATIAMLDAGGAKLGWSRSIAAAPGPLAIAGDLVVAVVGGAGTIALDDKPVAVRGAPGALALGLDARTGATRWTQVLGATGWTTVASVAALPGGDVAIGGSFAGTLGVGDAVVTSAGASDGFVARLGPRGEVRFVVRVGGKGADTVAGVAALGDRIAVAGTFMGDVDLRGVPLAPVHADVPWPDGFVASLGGDGRVAWARAFGSDEPDDVIGVAVTRSGRIAVAGTVRGVTYLGAGAASITAGAVEDWTGHGISDALVALWDASGEPVGSALLGGADYDGARAIAARGDEVVIGGWFAGAIELGGRSFQAGGGDDAFVAALDDNARVVRATALTGDGREDVSALGAAPVGWAAGVAFTTAAAFGDAKLAAPAEPDGGCALIFRAR
jgi:hypothetical protein